MSYVTREVRETMAVRLRLMRCDSCRAEQSGSEWNRNATLYTDGNGGLDVTARWPEGWFAFGHGQSRYDAHLCPACAKERLPALAP